MKALKKVLALVLCLVMVMGLSVAALAAEGEEVDPTKTTTLTIDKTAAGHTYEIYQMLIGDVSGLVNGQGTLANVNEGVNLSGTAEEFDAAIKSGDAYLTGVELAAAASAKIDVTKAFYAEIKGTGNVEYTYVAPGYYVVKDKYTDPNINNTNKTCAAYMVAVVGDTTMNPKTSVPDIDKNITDTDANKALETTGTSKKTDTAAIGDVIHYESTSAVPVTAGYKYYYYVVNDTMSEGLTFNNDLKITIDGRELTAEEYSVTVEKTPEDETSFKLVVNDMKRYPADAPIVITYSATVNENAKIGTEANTNTINLTYSNNPSDTYGKDKKPSNEPGDDDVVGVTPPRVTKTYVTQVSLQKTDADAKAFVDALKGATFKLSGTGLNDVKVLTETVFEVAENGEYYKLKDGTYTKTEPADATADKYVPADEEGNYTKYVTKTVVSLTEAESGAELNITAVVDAFGKITFTGLNAGSYKLEETNVPVGYNKCADIEFTISASQTGADAAHGGAIIWASNNAAVKQSMDGENALGVFEVTVANQKGNTLPATGGVGTTIFYIVGGVLVLAAVVLLVTKKRMARN